MYGILAPFCDWAYSIGVCFWKHESNESSSILTTARSTRRAKENPHPIPGAGRRSAIDMHRSGPFHFATTCCQPTFLFSLVPGTHNTRHFYKNTAMAFQHAQNGEKVNTRLATNAEPPIPNSIITTYMRTTIPELIIDELEDDAAQSSNVAPHRRPFKKRLRQLSTVPRDSQEEDVSDTSDDNGYGGRSCACNDDISSDLATSPPSLQRQSASVYAANPTHQLAFEKHSSVRIMPVLSPTTAPKSFFDGRSSSFSIFSSPRLNGGSLPSTFSEQFNGSFAGTLYPSAQAQYIQDLPDELFFSTKKQCHRQQYQGPSLSTTNATESGSRPNRVTPTPGCDPLSLAAPTSERSRTSYEQNLTKQDTHQSTGLGLERSASVRAPNLDRHEHQDVPHGKFPKASAHNRQSFRLETQSQGEEELGDDFILPHFLRTKNGRKKATVQDVLGILSIPPRGETGLPSMESAFTETPFQDVVFNPIEEPALKTHPPPSAPPFSTLPSYTHKPFEDIVFTPIPESFAPLKEPPPRTGAPASMSEPTPFKPKHHGDPLILNRSARRDPFCGPSREPHRAGFIPLSDDVMVSPTKEFPFEYHGNDLDKKPTLSPGERKPLYIPSPVKDICFTPL